MKVFIGGSISIKHFGYRVTDQLDKMMYSNMQILVGDANGVDSLVQDYCNNSWYSKVTVYACEGRARNNIGQWNVEAIDVPEGYYGRHFYERKDIAMANDCDMGFMIWDGRSIGTLNNIKRLIRYGKICYVYIPHLQQLRKIRCNDEIETLIKEAR